MDFNFNISNHSLTLASEPTLYSGNENYYRCKFNFLTDDWNGLLKFAVFSFGDTTLSTPIENNECMIPYEALSCESSIFVGVFGTNASEENYSRISTGLVYLFVGEGAYKTASLPAVPAPDLWERYYAEITRVGGFAQRAEDAKNMAELFSKDAENSKNSASQALADLLSMLGTDIATLIDGKIPVSQIPSIATTEIFFASSLSEMEELIVENGDICIRRDENKSYIFNDGWVCLASPTDYASRSGYSETAGTAENANTINNHRLIEMPAEEFKRAVKNENTYYLVY